ncbi:MAG: TonB-dependent receptor [Rhodanobacteraceae bacterium]
MRQLSRFSFARFSFARFSVIGIASILAVGARAEDAQIQPTIQVTASRVPETVDDTLASVSIVTRADIDASNAPDLIELLRLEAGVDLARSGGAGEQTAVFLRGTNSNHVLVLIDGVRVASVNTGAFAFENLPLDAVQRIEIVRGPRASYWGSDAIGGVIQIFTRKLNGPHVAASYGSYESAAGSAGYGTQTDAGGFSVQVGVRHVSGFSATNPAAGPYIYNPDDNGLQNHNLIAQGQYTFGAQNLSANIFRSDGTVSFDNGDPGFGSSRTLDQAIGVHLDGAITGDWQHRLSAGTSRENIETEAFGSAYRSTREQVSWSNDFSLAGMQHVVAGADYVHDNGRSLDTFGGTTVYAATRENTGIFAGWRATPDDFDSDLSGRYDHNSTFGNAFSGSAAAGWKFAQDWRLSASYGTAFRAPNLNELYSPGFGGLYAGNPLLNPERSRSAEVGLTWQVSESNRLDIRAFSTRILDLIDFSGGDTFQAVNVEHAKIDGLEITQAMHHAAWSWTNALTLQNPHNQDTGSQLLRRPRKKIDSVIETAIGERAHAGVELVSAGPSEDVGPTTLGGYTIFNLRADYVLTPAWKIGARVENLFDRDYQVINGYNTPGLSGYLTVTYSP